MTLDATTETTTEETQETQTTTETPPAEGQTTDAPAETADTAEAQTQGDSNDAEEDDGEESEKTDAPQKHQRKGGYQRRIERLERERELFLREREMFLEQLGQRGVVPPGAQPATPGQEKPQDPAVQLEQYLDAQFEKRLAMREAKAEQERKLAELQKKEEAFIASHEDYGDAVQAFARSGMPPTHVQALLTSEHGPAIMYQLVKNPAELARIRALPPVQAALEIGRLDARLASSTAAQTAPSRTAVPRKPVAPAPIAPVTARGPTTVKPVKDMTQEEYNAWRDSQRAKR
jgi:hypothetical protein